MLVAYERYVPGEEVFSDTAEALVAAGLAVEVAAVVVEEDDGEEAPAKKPAKAPAKKSAGAAPENK
jgi:hypothetical protein